MKNIKLSLCLVNHHPTKAHGEMQI